MVLGYEGRNSLLHGIRHRHRLHNIGARFRHTFAFGRIRSNRHKLVGRISFGRPQDHPQQRRFRLQIVAIVRGLSPIQFDGSGAGEKGRSLGILGKCRPRRRVGNASKYSDRAPMKIDPGTCTLAALDHDANRNTRKGDYRAQLTTSRCRTGKPVNKFCGFMRMVLSFVIANIR